MNAKSNTERPVDRTAELIEFAKSVAEYALECEDFYLASLAESVLKKVGVELVEPSVPVSKIREVFEQLDFSEPSARARRRLAAAFQMLTGEPLRKDAT